MDFYWLVSYIRKLGCGVRLYNKNIFKELNCEGYFRAKQKPCIFIALKNLDNEQRILILLHEFAHYIQWLTGYWDLVQDGGDVWAEVDSYIGAPHRKLPHREISRARRGVLLLEYDAEMRVINLARFLSIPINEEEYLRSANSYILQIKWALESGKWKEPLSLRKISSRPASVKNLLAPLTKEEKKIMGRRI